MIEQSVPVYTKARYLLAQALTRAAVENVRVAEPGTSFEQGLRKAVENGEAAVYGATSRTLLRRLVQARHGAPHAARARSTVRRAPSKVALGL